MEMDIITNYKQEEFNVVLLDDSDMPFIEEIQKEFNLNLKYQT